MDPQTLSSAALVTLQADLFIAGTRTCDLDHVTSDICSSVTLDWGAVIT